jgi:hypothetical protein
MEVHHHAHTARKKWTHYFWEFLMLFLAVFCGFFAEYQLEHKIEKEKGRQYIHSFYDDLKTDSAHISRLIRVFDRKIAALENRNNCFDSLSAGLPSNECIINLIMNSEGFSDFVYTDRTMQQLKNAGGLRLLKKADADSVLEYDKIIRFYIKSEGTALQELQSQLRNTMYSMVSYKSWLQINDTNNPDTPLLKDPDGDLVNRYFNLLDSYFFLCKYHMRELVTLKEKSISLLNYFKKKYSLK